MATASSWGNSLLTVILYVALGIGIIVLFFGIYSAFVSWVMPRMKRLQEGQNLIAPRALACCPPGLGCNDPDPQFRVCRRQKARQVATLDEHDQLEAAWAEYSAVPSARRKRRREAHDEFTKVRDRIIARALRDTFEEQNDGRKLLQSGSVESRRSYT